MADELNALVLIVEHRFFGDSRLSAGAGADDDYASYERLSLIEVRQVVADQLAVLRTVLREQRLAPAETDVIVFGVGDYGGVLAAWHRRNADVLGNLVSG